MESKSKYLDIDRIKSILLPVTIIFIFFLFWQIFSHFEIINVALFSSPRAILDVFLGRSLVSPSEFLNHILSSLFRLFVSFFVAVFVGIGIGVWMGLNSKVHEFFDPIVTVLMPIPGIAWAPLFIMWIGLGNPNVMTVGGLVAFFPIVHNTASGIRGVDDDLLKSADIMGVGNTQKIRKVLIPGSLPEIITGLKLGLARCWRTIIAVEMIAATAAGLGYMMIDASDHLLMAILYAGIIALAVIYFVMEYGLQILEEKTVVKWGMRDEVG